jgi:two-component system, cell cycle response regulator
MKDKILIVDDDPKTLELLKKKFNDNYDVETASNAEEALEVFDKTGPFTVVIADMKLPGMDGVNFLEKIKEKDPEAIRIILTGHADMDSAIYAVNKGKIYHFLTKPCPKDVLLNVVKIGVEHYKAEAKIKEESITDELTGLYNRRYFMHKTEEKIKAEERFSILFFDINKFKEINDKLGHEAGDRALKIFSDMLKRVCRTKDISARFGGDEFVILANDTNKTGALLIVNRLRELMKNETSSITLSIATGIVSYPEDSIDIEQLIKIADENMYKDKRGENV